MGLFAQPIVFVGPSLFPLPVDTQLEFRPPARRGDILGAARAGYRTIGLIDGEFDQSLSVSPHEIAEAARCGVVIYGAASMGALRACDCPDHMRGVGKIYEDFRRGILSSEDEVAVTYAGHDFRILTHPLVNVRLALEIAESRGIIAQDDADAILAEIREMPFQQRGAAEIVSVASRHIARNRADEILAILQSPAADQKRKDAEELVGLLHHAAR